MFKYIITNIVLLAVVATTAITSYNKGYNSGSRDITLEWEKNKVKTQIQIDNLQDKLIQLNKEYAEKTATINYELYKAKEKHTNDINTLRNEYEHRLHDSANRASLYKQMSKAGQVESRNLADYTTKYDSTITEGIQLVRELISVIELRDKQIKQLGNLLIEERDKINGITSRE